MSLFGCILLTPTAIQPIVDVVVTIHSAIEADMISRVDTRTCLLSDIYS